MKKTRTQYAILNSSIALSIQILKIILTFINRTVFIYVLGVYYLGLNGLFSSILSVLSLADLGVSSAMAYSLYKPLSENDKQKISDYVKLFKKIYNVIAFTILIIGTVLTFFLKFLIKEPITTEIVIIYYLFLFNSVISYLFTYKRVLLEADQKKYIITLTDFLVLLIGSIVQIIVILVFKNYYLYLIITILITFISNIAISIIVNKDYAYFKKENQNSISEKEKRTFVDNIKGLFFSKIGEVVVNGTDNILMSSFIGLTAVGLYSNYNMIIYTANTTITLILTAMMGSVGNLIHHKDSNIKRLLDFFKKYEFLVFTISYMASISLLIFLNIVVELWLGSQFLLPKHIILIIVVNFYITIYRLSSLTLITGFGLFSEQKLKALFEAIFNLIFSIILVKYTSLAIFAVLLGTLISSFATVMWYEPYSLFKYGFKISIKEYSKVMLKRYSFTIITFIVIYFLLDYIKYNMVTNILISMLLLLIISIIYLIINYQKPEFIYFKNIFLNIIKRKKV